MKLLSIITGAGAIAAATHATVIASGGYAGSLWQIPVAIGAGLIVGSIAVGRAWGERRFALSTAIALALICGEAFALVNTGGRIIAQRDAAMTPYRAAVQAHQRAAEAVAAAERALPTSTPRLEAAERAVREADATVAEKAAERTCVANCRALLDRQTDAARAERDAARRELDGFRSAAIKAVDTAKAALAAAPMPARPEGLAERLGIEAATLDLIAAALGSLAINGLGATLIAFGAHRRTVPAVLAGGRPSSFLVAAIRHHAGSRIAVRDLYAGYLKWCASEHLAPVDPASFGDDLRAIADRFRLPVYRDDADGLILDCLAVVDQPIALPALAAA